MSNKVEQIIRLLPGVDCGGSCGHSTCSDCANAIAQGASPALCPVCTQKTVDAIAEIMEVETVSVKKKVAFIHCAGTNSAAKRLAGCFSCKEAVDSGFLDTECSYGCVGRGSCQKVCKFDAITNIGGAMKVDREKCTGCGACIDVCPQHLTSLVPYEATNLVPCASKDENQRTRELCVAGCVGCGDCVENCPTGAMTLVDNHAVINYDLCSGCLACTVSCRKKIIVDLLHDLPSVKNSCAFVSCNGGVKAKAKYEAMGITSCAEAAKLAKQLDKNTTELCRDGCMGLGSCIKVCRHNAISIKDSAAWVDPAKCVGCMECVRICPQEIIHIVPYKGIKLIPCVSDAPLEVKGQICKVGCMNCKSCVNNCPVGAAFMEGRHATINYDLCVNCSACSYVCSNALVMEQKVPEFRYLQIDAMKNSD